MSKEFCSFCQKIFIKIHKCVNQERYTRFPDGNRARSYLYQCKQCHGQLMHATQRLQHQEFHRQQTQILQFPQKFFSLWKLVLSQSLVSAIVQEQCDWNLKMALSTRFRQIANTQLSIVRNNESQLELKQMKSLLQNQSSFYDRLFSLKHFSRKTFKNQEVQSIIFFQWILLFLKCRLRPMTQCIRLNYCTNMRIGRFKQKTKKIKKDTKAIKCYKRRQTALIRKQLLYNNIVDYFNVDYNEEGKTTFDSSVFKLQIYQKMILFLDKFEHVQKKASGYRINLSYFKKNEKQIVQYLNSFNKVKVYQKLSECQPLSKQLQSLLRSDKVYQLIQTQIVNNLQFLSIVVGNYQEKVNKFKIKFSDSDPDTSMKKTRVSKKKFELRCQYQRKMLDVCPCFSNDFDLLMNGVEFQKNVSQTIFRSLTKLTIIAEQHDQVQRANQLFRTVINLVRKKQIKYDSRVPIEKYCQLKKQYKSGKQINRKDLEILFWNQNTLKFQDLVQEKLREQYNSVYFRKTFELCLQFACNKRIILFKVLQLQKFSDYNYLLMEKYRVRSVYQNQKKYIRDLLEDYYTPQNQQTKNITLAKLWEVFTWKRGCLMSPSFYVQCIQNELLRNNEKKREWPVFNFQEKLLLKQEYYKLNEEQQIISIEQQLAFVNNKVWSFIDKAYSRNAIKKFNDLFSLWLIDPQSRLPTATFYLKRHRTIINAELQKLCNSINNNLIMFIEDQVQALQKILFEPYMQQLISNFSKQTFKQLVYLGDSESMRQKIITLFNELKQEYIDTLQKQKSIGYIAKWSKHQIISCWVSQSSARRVKMLKIKERAGSDLNVLTVDWNRRLVRHNYGQYFDFQILNKYKNTRRCWPKQNSKSSSVKWSTTRTTISMSSSSVDGQKYDNQSFYRTQQYFFTQEHGNLIAPNIQTITSSNSILASNEEPSILEEQKSLSSEDQRIIQQNVSGHQQLMLDQKAPEFQFNIQAFEALNFYEMNILFKAHYKHTKIDYFETIDQQSNFLTFYNTLLNKVDLPLKLQSGKTFRKYPNLWTLKQIYQIQKKRKYCTEIKVTVQQMKISKQQKGIFKYRKCGLCMTRNHLNYCCEVCLTLYHKGCYKMIDYCVICVGQIQIQGIIDLFISPATFNFYQFPFNLSNTQSQEENKNINLSIIKVRGIHTFENRFQQGFIFRNHFPKILYLTADIEESIKRYNKRYSLPFKIKATKTMGFGCFATIDIKQNSYLCEYCGDVVNPSKTVNSQYTYHLWPGFTGIDEYCISPSSYWSQANYLNHSNEPNCFASTVMSYRGPRILIFTKRKILKGEQLFYNYNGAFSLYAKDWEG